MIRQGPKTDKKDKPWSCKYNCGKKFRTVKETEHHEDKKCTKNPNYRGRQAKGKNLGREER